MHHTPSPTEVYIRVQGNYYELSIEIHLTPNRIDRKLSTVIKAISISPELPPYGKTELMVSSPLREISDWPSHIGKNEKIPKKRSAHERIIMIRLTGRTHAQHL